MKILVLAALVTACLSAGSGPRAATYYVALDGDQDNDGSQAHPWPSVSYAVRQVQGGDVIVVKDGVYHGYTGIHLEFDDWVTIRAENPYRAVLTNPLGATEIILLLGARRLILEGLVFTNVDPDYVCPGTGSNWVVHFQDARDIIFRNNIVFGNRAADGCNTVFAINRSDDLWYTTNIQITGNVFYDNPDVTGNRLLFLNSLGEVDLTENIFFSRNSSQASTLIDVYRDAPEDAVEPRSPRFNVARNIFLNWNGVADSGFIRIGQSWDEARWVDDFLFENNLMIGNSQSNTVAPIQVRAVEGLNVRANTIVGDFPGSAYAMNLYHEGIDVRKKDIYIRNNIWSDATGTMGDRFIDYRVPQINAEDVNIVLNHNLYFNAGNPLPSLQAPAPGADTNALVADPLISGDHAGLVLPVWDSANHRFASGSATIREEFERLVNTYGAIAEGSPAIGAADPANMPAVDILGRQRDAAPDIGAFEFIAEQPDAGSDAGTDDGGSGGDGDSLPGWVILRAGPPVPAGRVITPGSGQVILRLALDAHDANGRLEGLRVQLPGLREAEYPWARVQLALYTDPEGDGNLDSTSTLVGGAWIADGQAFLLVGGLQFSPGDQYDLLLELSATRLSASRAGFAGLLWLLVLAALLMLLRGRPGIRLAAGFVIFLALLACSRYGFKPTIFKSHALIESPADIDVSPELSVDLEPTPLEGEDFKLSL